MTAMWIIVLVLAASVASRIMRSTKMWWTLIFTIIFGLLVGVLSKEAVNSSSKKSAASYTQLINSVESGSAICMQSLVSVVTVDDANCLTGVAGYKYAITKTTNKLINNTLANGRDSPSIEDDS